MFSENVARGEIKSANGARGGPEGAIANLIAAINNHDIDAMAACFDPEYQSEFPAHPERSFRGHGQMRKNWSQIFAAVPDIQAVLVSLASEGDTVWAEWEWKGTRKDGLKHLMRGVTIQGMNRGRIAWVKLYMEPVQTGAGTDPAFGGVLTGK